MKIRGENPKKSTPLGKDGVWMVWTLAFINVGLKGSNDFFVHFVGENLVFTS